MTSITRFTFRSLAVSALAVCAASAQPTVSAVLNNASYALPGLPNAPLAQGSLMAIFGTGLASGNMTATSFPLQTNMGGTTVRVTVGGTSVDALMIYTTPGQLGALLPSNTPLGNGTLTVTFNGQTSRPANLTIVRSAFGIFTANQQGSGPGAVQNVVTSTEQPINTLTQPARPGQTMILWGTGLGPTTQNEAAGAVPGDLAGVNVEVFVGGRPAAVSYKGRSGCCAGIDQVAYVVPEGVEGCYVPVVVKTGDVVSNFATISVARTGNSCSDPLGFTGEELQRAQATGQMRIGGVHLTRLNSRISVSGFNLDSRIDTGTGYFARYDLNQLTRAQGATGNEFSVSLGACSVVSYRTQGNNTTPRDPIRPVELDAGPAISVSGPRGQKQLTRQEGGYYGELGGGTTGIPGQPPAQPDYLEAGNYTISAPGGSGPNSVGNFSVQMNVPQLLTWTNEASITSPARSSNLPITWTGGAPDTYVYINGMSMNQDVASMFICLERASAGSFTIPSYVLSVLPPSAGQFPGFLSVGGTTNPVRFQARDLDIGTVSASSFTQKTVTWR